MEARSFATKVFRVGDFSVLFILDSGDLYPFVLFLLFTAYTIGLVDSDRRELSFFFSRGFCFHAFC